METVTERELFGGILGCFLFPFCIIGNFVTNLPRREFPMERKKETYNSRWGVIPIWIVSPVKQEIAPFRVLFLV